MIKSVALPSKQILLLAKTQTALDLATGNLNLVCATILSGLEIEGKITLVDSDKNTIEIEVPEKPDLRVEA